MTLAITLADEPSSSADLPTARTAATAAYDVAPVATIADGSNGSNGSDGPDARTVLESTLSRPEPAGPVDLTDAKGVIPGFERLGPIHVDPPPAGVSLDDPTDTESLYARAGLAVPDTAVETAASAVPPGTPSTKGLTQHVAPSCTGTGTDGKRVQVLYVRETATASRYAALLPLFRNEIANVDDVFAVSAQKTGGDRRVRWVHASCVPVVQEVVVPNGSLNGNFSDTISALERLGFTDRARKYVAFAEADDLCGIGTMYNDARSSGNLNDGSYASYSRIDRGCWSTSGHSVMAHELTHNLGGVLKTAPHATTYGHCYDESDLMCYNDGSGIAMRSVCGSAQEQLLDCNSDDYFHTAPPANSFLATSWNTARSSFLDTPAPVPPLTVTATPSRTTAETGDVLTATATSAGATGYHWTASRPCTLTGVATSRVSVLCPADVTGPVVLTVTATDADDRTATASTTVDLARAAAPTATVTAPDSVDPGQSFAPSAQVTGKAPFTYRWTATSPCTVFASSSAQPQAACVGGTGVGTGSIGLTVTQADGQVVEAASAAVSVTDASSGSEPLPVASVWSATTATSRDPALISAVLTDTGSGLPFTGAVVELQTRASVGQAWQTAAAGLTTGPDGRVSVERARTTAAWYRFAYAGDLAGTHAASLSSDVLVKARTTAKSGWRASRSLTTGRLLRADGSPVAGATLMLERRYAGTTRWVAVTSRTTAADGTVAVRQRPARTAYFRWVYRGNAQHLSTRSASVLAR